MGYLIVRILTAILLLWSLDKHPYGYYTLLRFIVCGVAAYGAYFAHKINNKSWVWILAIVAVLFNPIRPIYLDRSTWHAIDIIVAAILLISLAFLRESKRKIEPVQPKELPADNKKTLLDNYKKKYKKMLRLKKMSQLLGPNKFILAQYYSDYWKSYPTDESEFDKCVKNGIYFNWDKDHPLPTPPEGYKWEKNPIGGMLSGDEPNYRLWSIKKFGYLPSEE